MGAKKDRAGCHHHIITSTKIKKNDRQQRNRDYNIMTIVSIMDRATSSWSIIAVLVTISCSFLFLVAPHLQQSIKDEAGPPPDLRFGYTSSELNEWYDSIGEEGCDTYKKLALLDLFPFMESYTLLFGGLLVKAARYASVDTDIALLVPVIMLCDVVETAIPAYGCVLYPEKRLPVILIQIAAAASRLKWTLFIVCNVALSFLFFSSVLKAAVKKRKKQKSNAKKAIKKASKKKE